MWTSLKEQHYILFLPFLLFYIILIFLFHSDGNQGDESQYLMFANNLIHGFYSPSAPSVDLSVGPGYALILVPFVAAGFPLISLILLNAFFYYLSIVFLFKSCLHFVTFNFAFGISLFWAFHYYSIKELFRIQPELFTTFLITFLMFIVLKVFIQHRSSFSLKFLLLAGLVIGYLALTKVIFGYVIVVLFLGLLILLIFKHNILNYKKSFLMLITSFVLTGTYLCYTYHLTDKLFYWGTSGGNNLYWMSTPHENEYGDWTCLDSTYVFSVGNRIVGSYDSLKVHHQANFEEVSNLNNIELDEALKRMAIVNIKSNPIKFIQNCISNIGRMLFDYPYSYSSQNYRDLLRLPYAGFVVILMLFCIIPTLKNWSKIPFPIRFLMFFVIVYLGGSVFGSAEMRMFIKVEPVIFLWIAYIIQNSVKINLDF
jgi:hypothetical protein